MRLADLVEFARQNFGSLQGLPPQGGNVPSGDNVGGPRPPLPAWLDPEAAGRIPTLASSDAIVIEGPPTPVGASTGNGKWSIDVLAYYLPFHFYRQNWGIYLLASGVARLATVLLTEDPLARTDQSRLELARRLLLGHEEWHFRSELAAAGAEVVGRLPAYQDYFLRGAATSLEEALANAWALRYTFGTAKSGARDRAIAWMRSQGPGYRNFASWLRQQQFEEGKRQAATFMIERFNPARGTFGSGPTILAIHQCGKPSAHTPLSLPWPAEFLFPGRIQAQDGAPVRVVGDITWLRTARRFPKFRGLVVAVHSNDHPPPHIHIQHPPGADFTRYEWPALQPLKGDPKLSGRAAKDLDAYVQTYGGGIRKRLEAVYGPLRA
jgi:hypothetical protein